MTGMLQVPKHGLYTYDENDPDGCGICAGAATSDGNDAQVTKQQSTTSR